MSYSFPKSTILPYESLWSIMHKFVHLNVCDVKDIQDAFHENRNIKGGWYIASLLRKPSWSFERLATALGVDKSIIRDGIVGTHLKKKEIEKLSCKHIRYCPECIALGYHSIIHQLYIFNNCPFHDTELIEKCPSCERLIDPGLNAKAISSYYSCRYCSQELFDFSHIIALNDSRLGEVFKKIGDILKVRMERIHATADLGVLTQGSQGTTGRLWNMWQSIYGKEDKSGNIIRYFKNDNLPTGYGCDLTAGYVDFLHQIQANYLDDHVNCVEFLIGWNNSIKYVRHNCGEIPCEKACAYIFMRLYFEINGHNLFKTNPLKHISQIKQQIPLTGEDERSLLPVGLAYEIFKYECRSIWLSSIIHVQRSSATIQHGQQVSDELVLYFPPYWEVAHSNEGKGWPVACFELPNIQLTSPVYNEIHLQALKKSIYDFDLAVIRKTRMIHPRG